MARTTTPPAPPRTLPEMTSTARGLWRTLQVWSFRRRSRQMLARLNAHYLRDIGLDPLTARAECAKPFWRD